jgi:hypothetical protein
LIFCLKKTASSLLYKEGVKPPPTQLSFSPLKRAEKDVAGAVLVLCWC